MSEYSIICICIYLYNHMNYLYLYSDWAGPKPEVGRVVLKWAGL